MQVPGSKQTVSMLATGDMQETPMGTLLASGAVQRADILKIAHHGAGNGGTEIIDVVRPAVALISVGKGQHVRASEPGHHRSPAAQGRAGPAHRRARDARRWLGKRRTQRFGAGGTATGAIVRGGNPSENPECGRCG